MRRVDLRAFLMADFVLAMGKGVQTQTPPDESRSNSFAPGRRRGWSWGRKPDSVPGLRRVDRHFSQVPCGTRPPPPAERAWEDATYPGLQDGPSSPLFCLAPDWVFPATGITAGAVGSYPTFS